MRDRAAAVPDDLAAAVRAASPDAPAPGEWTPTDIVRHMIGVEGEVWQPRVRQLIDEEEPRWAWVEPDRWEGSPDASLDDLLTVYADLRAATVQMLDDLDEAGWAKTGTHATFGRLDAAGLMRRAVDHDREHIESLEA